MPNICRCKHCHIEAIIKTVGKAESEHVHWPTIAAVLRLMATPGDTALNWLYAAENVVEDT